LRAEILHRHAPPSRAPLVVYDSDSRNCPADEAARRVARLARRLRALRPGWVYKKTDSVLRGNVLAELEALARTLGVKRCLLAPANPAAGRVIRGGEYFVRGVPLDQTDFRNDPRHPRRTASVVDLLGAARRGHVAVLPRPAPVLPDGVSVGEAGSGADVARWAGVVDTATLPAGGADFFTALLRARGFQPGRKRFPTTPLASILFVSGSMAQASLAFLGRMESADWPVFRLSQMRQLPVERIVGALRSRARVGVCIGSERRMSPAAGQRLGRRLVAVAAEAVARARPGCVCVEGGATAALLLEALGFRRLAVACEFATGVTGVRPVGRRGPLLVLKPGSYAWPDCFRP
jgi:uncharacterized protein YgbK (DUF1537 family)